GEKGLVGHEAVGVHQDEVGLAGLQPPFELERRIEPDVPASHDEDPHDPTRLLGCVSVWPTQATQHPGRRFLAARSGTSRWEELSNESPSMEGGIAVTDQLKGKRIAFLAADAFEQVELTEPWKAVEQAGGLPELV